MVAQNYRTPRIGTRDAIARVTIHRPQVNVLDEEMLADLVRFATISPEPAVSGL